MAVCGRPSVVVGGNLLDDDLEKLTSLTTQTLAK